MNIYFQAKELATSVKEHQRSQLLTDFFLIFFPLFLFLSRM